MCGCLLSFWTCADVNKNIQQNKTTMFAQVIENEIYPDSTITIALFKNVGNAKELRQCVMSGAFEATLLKPSMVSIVVNQCYGCAFGCLVVCTCTIQVVP